MAHAYIINELKDRMPLFGKESKKKEKELAASKDQIHSFNEIVQKITDEFIKKIDDVITAKEKELMKI